MDSHFYIFVFIFDNDSFSPPYSGLIVHYSAQSVPHAPCIALLEVRYRLFPMLGFGISHRSPDAIGRHFVGAHITSGETSVLSSSPGIHYSLD